MHVSEGGGREGEGREGRGGGGEGRGGVRGGEEEGWGRGGKGYGDGRGWEGKIQQSTMTYTPTKSSAHSCVLLTSFRTSFLPISSYRRRLRLCASKRPRSSQRFLQTSNILLLQ